MRPFPQPERAPTAWLWRIDLTDDRQHEAMAVTLLHDRERQRSSRGTETVRRRRILLRAGLRQALGTFLDQAPADVPLIEDDGRPLLEDRADVHVSCSASGRVGLIAVVAGCEVGVDVEKHDEGNARAAAAEGWLAPAEEWALRRLPSAERPLAATRCWTQKEAVLKGLGLGLRRRPSTVVTPMARVGRIGDWVIRPVPVPPNYVATVVVRTPMDDVGLVIRDMTVGVIP
jgi:4'-phosphopantetheinyl transferase